MCPGKFSYLFLASILQLLGAAVGVLEAVQGSPCEIFKTLSVLGEAGRIL
jgi:hypothetical protein